MGRRIAVQPPCEHVRRCRVVPRADEWIRRRLRTRAARAPGASSADQIEQAPRERPVPARDRLAEKLAVLVEDEPVRREQRGNRLIALDSRSCQAAHLQLSVRGPASMPVARLTGEAVSVCGHVRVKNCGLLQVGVGVRVPYR